MSVEPYLSQTQQQRLQMVLAPQLRQSLNLLQVPMLELRSLIREEMERNPVLEEKPLPSTPVSTEEPSGSSDAEMDAALKEEFEILSRLDEEWREYFHQDRAAHVYTSDDEERRRHFFDSLTLPESLQEHLRNQLAVSDLSPEDRRLAEMLIGSINDDGYLVTPLEELAQTTGSRVEDLERILQAIQEFDPIGVGARDLRECLRIQLRRLGKENSLAERIVDAHLEDLAAHRYEQIARATGASLEAVREAARLIATLEPKPGRQFAPEATHYVLPEIFVHKVGDEYVVTVDREHLPRLYISPAYRKLMEREDTPEEVRRYIREKVRAGLFLIRSLHQRQQTIHRIASEIVKIQKDFFDHGISHLKPLTMAAVARTLGLHETTVSRAIANKYMQTPRGLFEMKYFFTPGYKTRDGQEVSNKTIKDLIAQLIAQEDPDHPLSDHDIVERLKEKGFEVARRTVAKYRQELHILPSHLRRASP